MLNPHGSTRDSIAPTTATVTGGSIELPESSSWKSFILTLSNVKNQESGSRRMLLTSCGWCLSTPLIDNIANGVESSEMNIFAMRLGPGKHLQGRVLLGGVIGTEEYDHFHEVRKVRPPGRCELSQHCTVDSKFRTCSLWMSWVHRRLPRRRHYWSPTSPQLWFGRNQNPSGPRSFGRQKVYLLSHQ